MGEWGDERIGISPGGRGKMEEKELEKELGKSAENSGPRIPILKPSATCSPCLERRGIRTNA